LNVDFSQMLVVKECLYRCFIFQLGLSVIISVMDLELFIPDLGKTFHKIQHPVQFVEKYF
jgi:hypothetical protein